MVALQDWVMVWPLANCQATVHEVIAEPPAVTVTVPWKPPCQCPAIAYAAEHDRPAGGGLDDGGPDDGLDGGRLLDADALGLVGGVLMLPGTDRSALYQTAAILSYPADVGWTPSVRSDA